MAEVDSVLTVTAEAEVVTALDTLLAIRALAESRQMPATDGGLADLAAVWPREILRILNGDLT
jgi:hypothetical protein